MPKSPADPPHPKITVSRETTFLQAPLRPDGYVDYLAAIHEAARRNISPEDNAAVDLLKALGPSEIMPDRRESFFEMLGMPPLPEEGEYFIELIKFDPSYDLPDDRLSISDEERKARQKKWEDAWFEVESARAAPWSPEEHPHLAALLARNARAFEHFKAGSKKDNLYLPFFGDDAAHLCKSYYPSCSLKTDESARQLAMRAMLHVHSGDIRSAWEDILACFRWGRLFCQNLVHSEYIGSQRIEGIARYSTTNFLSRTALTKEQIHDCLKDLSNLPLRMPIRARWNHVERFYELDRLQYYAVHGYNPEPQWTDPILLELGEDFLESLKESTGQSDRHHKVFARLIGDPDLDWNEALRCCNEWFDRAVAAFDLPDYRSQSQELWNLEQELHERAENALCQASEDYFDSLNADPQSLARQLAEILISLGAGYWRCSLEFEFASLTQQNLCIIAFALADYRRDHGHYPQELEELSPAYLAEVPQDVFTDEPLHYAPESDGYFLYSVGPNCTDDGGRHFTDKDYESASDDPYEEYCSRPDDIALRMPRPSPSQ